MLLVMLATMWRTEQAWRANGGPKLAVVANADERLNVTLENMGILPYFDFVLTTHEVGVFYQC